MTPVLLQMTKYELLYMPAPIVGYFWQLRPVSARNGTPRCLDHPVGTSKCTNTCVQVSTYSDHPSLPSWRVLYGLAAVLPAQWLFVGVWVMLWFSNLVHFKCLCVSCRKTRCRRLARSSQKRQRTLTRSLGTFWREERSFQKLPNIRMWSVQVNNTVFVLCCAVYCCTVWPLVWKPWKSHQIRQRLGTRRNVTDSQPWISPVCCSTTQLLLQLNVKNHLHVTCYCAWLTQWIIRRVLNVLLSRFYLPLSRLSLSAAYLNITISAMCITLTAPAAF